MCIYLYIYIVLTYHTDHIRSLLSHIVKDIWMNEWWHMDEWVMTYEWMSHDIWGGPPLHKGEGDMHPIHTYMLSPHSFIHMSLTICDGSSPWRSSHTNPLTHTHPHTHTHIRTHTHTHIHTHTYTPMCFCLCARVWVCEFTCARVLLSVRTWVCVFICARECVCVCACVFCECWQHWSVIHFLAIFPFPYFPPVFPFHFSHLLYLYYRCLWSFFLFCRRATPILLLVWILLPRLCGKRVAVCCSVLQCAAVCCSVLQRVAVYFCVLQCVAVFCSMLQGAVWIPCLFGKSFSNIYV